MTKLVSEQLPNDGAYPIKRLVKESNERLRQIGRQGKRATIVAKKSSLSLQFTFKDGNGRSQKNVGLGAISVNARGIAEAESIAEKVTYQLVSGTFNWEWFNQQIGKPSPQRTKQLTCKQMVEQYKKHYFKQREGNKTVKSGWYKSCKHIEITLGDLDKPLSLSLIRKIIECTSNNSVIRIKSINGLVAFLKYFDVSEYKSIIKEYKANNKPKPKKRNVPDEKQITDVYNNGFNPKPNTAKKIYYRYPQWQFLFSLLAIYGLRIHEAWNIANWNKPVALKNGDWVTISLDEESKIELQHQTEELIIPAILDPDNKDCILCIKHNTKTGYRMAIPISPQGRDWVKEFNLLQPLNLPDIENPLRKDGKYESCYQCTNTTGQWFKRNGYGFTPHDLRHAYNHRGHQLGYNPKALADSLGHSITMNTSGYLKHMSDSVKLKGMKDTMNNQLSKRSENQLLKEQIEQLKAQLQAKHSEIEVLSTKLRMYEAIEVTKGKS